MNPRLAIANILAPARAGITARAIFSASGLQRTVRVQFYDCVSLRCCRYLMASAESWNRLIRSRSRLSALLLSKERRATDEGGAVPEAPSSPGVRLIAGKSSSHHAAAQAAECYTCYHQARVRRATRSRRRAVADRSSAGEQFQALRIHPALPATGSRSKRVTATANASSCASISSAVIRIGRLAKSPRRFEFRRSCDQPPLGDRFYFAM